MSDDDDQLVGRILSRRRALMLLGAGAVLLPACKSGGGSESAAGGSGTTTTSTTAATTAAAAATATTAAGAGTVAVAAPSCVVVPALTEGPYFVDEKLNRSDIRTDPSDNSARPGTPLKINVRVSRLSGGACAALPAATVDVWHCDAGGLYSDESANNTVGKKFLRGYQTTDANGACAFTTIYPGWYQGRAVHIHFKIRSGGHDFTSQWFFDDAINTTVFAQSPYSSHGQSPMKNSADDIYRQSNGQTILTAKQDGSGYTATFDVGMQF